MTPLRILGLASSGDRLTYVTIAVLESTLTSRWLVLVLKEDASDAGHGFHGAGPVASRTSNPRILAKTLESVGIDSRLLKLLIVSEQLLLDHVSLLREVRIMRRVIKAAALGARIRCLISIWWSL
jgi:hypothetical protein